MMKKTAKGKTVAKEAAPGQPELIQIAHVTRDPFNVYYQGIMRSEDATLATRGGPAGIDTYDEIERDCHAYSVIEKRKAGLISRPWIVDPASDSAPDKAVADLVRANLAAIPFDRICSDLLDATLKGYAVGEVIWHVQNGKVLVKTVLPRGQRRFVFDIDNKPRLLTTADMIKGEELPERKFVVHRFGSKTGNPYGLGLGTRLFWPVFFKRKGLGFWLTFCDKFSSPTAVAKYPRGTPQEDIDNVVGFLQGIATDAGFAIPDDMVVELLEAARSGSIDTHEKLCRYMDEEISKAVLGETLSTNMQGGGSYAAARTHNEVRLELVQRDSDLLAETINDSICVWITSYNIPGANPPRVYRDISEKRDLKGQAETDKILHEMGFESSEERIAHTYGEGWTKRAPPAAASARALQYSEAASAPDQDALDAMLANLPAAASAALEPILIAIRDILNHAATPDEAMDTLLDAFPSLPNAALVEALTSAIAIADIWGRISSQAVPA